MALSWVAADARTGKVLAEMPDLSCERVGVVLGAYTSAAASLPVPTAPEGWARATLPGGAFLVLLDDDEPSWGGLVTRRTRTLGDTVDLSLATIEAYLDRRYVRDRTFTGASQTQIVRLLVEEFATDFPIEVEVAPSVVTRDRAYANESDKTLLSVLTELSGVEDGPEFTVRWAWRHDPERLVPVLHVADRIGSPVPPDLGPAATFEAPGPVVQLELVEDYGAGKGATDVMAVSSGSVGERPQSPRQIAAQSERPPFEFRFTPSTSITEVSTLTSHAAEALALMADGARTLSLAAVIDQAPRLGRDWWIGDDIGYRVGDVWTERVGLFPGGGAFPGPATFPAQPEDVEKYNIPAFPGGLMGVARCIGWEIDLTGVPTVAPILEMED
ncbi:hypothetical protein [Cellulomonas shaoxiangyii]|uniref:Uncharacterized protein n=1 Tax=Cellulomonas shaoxiangyii TaxID=2566013 RepID=A0A4P7SKM1_9CELL|nr:hypothetical protein [Cellulomonas shaoxiangyii]QCB93294.1 hypothetical protein E5225_06765 [Cellulomonas shaoxiangyii]TGY82487.1 hypothetical protein E5226_13185 [Cellulomonas shaoxiangyii]